MDKDVFSLLYKSMIWPHLEYAALVWSPYMWKLAEQIKKVQRRATKRIPGLHDLPYEQRLQMLKLPTLVYRRLHGDLINTYKYIHGKYDTKPCIPGLVTSTRTRGHSLRLEKNSARTNKRLFFFSNRVVVWWNSLPEEVVTAPSVDSFKSRLDKHFENHPVVYDSVMSMGSVEIF